MTQNSLLEKTQRLFVAVELPATVRQLLTERQKGPQGMRWTASDNLHLTVRFIGETSPAQVAAIKAGLRDVRAEGFSLRIKGLGFFDGRQQAVLWAGIEASKSLAALKRQVDDALERHAGIKAADGRFSPHITLGRTKQADRKSLRAFMPRESAPLSAGFAVESFTLFSSVLEPGGAAHTAEERYPLGGGSVPVTRTGCAAVSLQGCAAGRNRNGNAIH